MFDRTGRDIDTDLERKQADSKYRHLFEVLPIELQDAAFLDRIYAYLPGWEMPKIRPENYATGYGLLTDYMAEIFAELRRRNFQTHVIVCVNMKSMTGSRVSPQILEEFKAFRLKEVSKVTINHDLKILASMLNWAIKRNYITKDPAKEVARYRVESKLPRFFSRQEIRLILESCSAHMRPILMILLHTGMRKGELANLEWRDVDFERGVIKITPKVGWMPKGKRGREIPINDALLPVLLELKATNKGCLVVEKTNDKPYTRGLWLDFKRLARKLGMEDVNIHTFRHTFASYLVMSGVDIVTVKELLGHSEIAMMMRYAHLVPGHRIAAVNRICDLTQFGTNLAPGGGAMAHNSSFITRLEGWAGITQRSKRGEGPTR